MGRFADQVVNMKEAPESRSNARPPPRNVLRIKRSKIAISRITNLYPYEHAILSRARCSALLWSGCEAKDLLRRSSGQAIIDAVLDSPTVQRSRSFGFAETVSKHFLVRVACLRMADRGVEMDR